MCVFYYHFGHIFGDRLGGLHGVNGHSASLLHRELTFKTLQKLFLSEIKFGVAVVFPLKHINKDQTHTHKDKISLSIATYRETFLIEVKLSNNDVTLASSPSKGELDVVYSLSELKLCVGMETKKKYK